MNSATTVKVSKTTLAELEKLRRKLGAKSLDDTIKVLLRKQRMEIIDAALGVDKGRINRFTEQDSGEDC
jgi:hypothetical protein